MSVVTRRGTVSLLFGLLLSASALAQTAPGNPSWTDPPTRGAEGPKPDIAKPETKAPVAEKAPAEPTPAERAATTLGVKPVEAGKQTASNGTAQTHRRVVRPRMVERPMVITRRRVHTAARVIHRRSHQATRATARNLALAAEYRSARRHASISSRRRLAEWGNLIEENPASRAAAARGPGYAATHMPTNGAPQGRRFQSRLPFDGADFGDLD
ncbi:hypothetical protein HCU64_04110 [Methylobacterium sp. C25]|uniref:hypothetical protein n=1 Tax=Methylobacterium sp. C25 TaxID=2721622 RepID=UPI001F409BD3|nr:hypothetical protein [Methylobacterium sp. C25]MCE4222926.1 hypothetical protein [Methylobacterium sp. C25]